MSYSIQVAKKAEQVTTNWSGGTTTQISIYPCHADYGQRDFTWRLSTATVDLEHSTFTSLSGFSRILMVLEGEVRLVHAGHHSADLKFLQQDSFSGDWSTQSFGQVRDFNLMMAPNCQGKLHALTVLAKASIEICSDTSYQGNGRTSAFYCVDGSVQCIVNEKAIDELHGGDVLILYSEQSYEKFTLKISNVENDTAHVIQAEMQY